MSSTIGDGQVEAARKRVEAVLDRLRHVDLQVVVVAPPDASRLDARDRASAAAASAGRTELLAEAAAAAREGTLRAFAVGGFSGTWAATEMAVSVANASDRVAAATAFEEAAMAAVVEDLVDDETLETLQATSRELDRSTGLPAPGSLAGVTSSSRIRGSGPVLLVVQVSIIALAAVFAATLGIMFGILVLGVGLVIIARLKGP